MNMKNLLLVKLASDKIKFEMEFERLLNNQLLTVDEKEKAILATVREITIIDGMTEKINLYLKDAPKQQVDATIVDK